MDILYLFITSYVELLNVYTIKWLTPNQVVLCVCKKLCYYTARIKAQLILLRCFAIAEELLDVFLVYKYIVRRCGEEGKDSESAACGPTVRVN